VSVETFPAAGKSRPSLFLSVRHEDVRMFKQHMMSTAKPGPTPDISGRRPVYLRCPGFVAKTDAAAQETYGPTLNCGISRTKAALLADSSRRQNSPPDPPRWKTSRRLTEITLEETLRGSVFICSPIRWWGNLKDLQTRHSGCRACSWKRIARAWLITRRSERRSGYWRGRLSRAFR